MTYRNDVPSARLAARSSQPLICTGIEDYYRYRADCLVNMRLHAVVSHHGGAASITPVECHSIRVGDLVRVREHDDSLPSVSPANAALF